jgi:uncharacterized protein YybS (DUF2232 family)
MEKHYRFIILILICISLLFYITGNTIEAIYWVLYVICGLLMFGHIGIFKDKEK